MTKALNSIFATMTANPLFLAENGAAFLEGFVAHASAQGTEIAKMQAEFASTDDYWPSEDSWLARYRPYVVKDGVLRIPVDGVLLNKLSLCLPGWATGYEYIQRAFDRGREDGNVRAIAFIVDSPGGLVAGNFELTDHIYEARGEKPILAFASDHAYSAAYNIASAADPGRLYVTRSGGVGSIGVLTAHADFSGAMDKMGVKMTLMFKGKHKVDGNPYETLSEQAKVRMDARLDKLYTEFVSTVARNRGMDDEEVRATEALTYDSQDAVAVGLADAVGEADAEIEGFLRELETGDDLMSNQNGNRTGQAPENNNEQAVNDARNEGVSAGRKEERERMTAILNSPEGKDRPNAARAALETSMSADEAIRFMASLPKETQQQGNPPQGGTSGQQPQGQGGQHTDHFAAAMNNGKNPDVGASTNGGEKASDSDTILGDFGLFTGFRDKSKVA